MKKVVVIVAGGSGQRMGTDIPKQFLTIQGKPIFIYSIDRFREAFTDIEIIMTLPVNVYMSLGMIKQRFNWLMEG